MVKKFVILYSFKLEGALGAIEKHNTKDIGGHWKRPKVFWFLEQQRTPKRTLKM
jgi:hypothetical protein